MTFFWPSEHPRPDFDLAEPAVIWTTLDALTVNLDGSRAAGMTIARKRAVLSNALSYAVELNLLAANSVAVSTWLNSGVAPTQVAEWAGHSVAVLLEIYAKCIDGQQQASFATARRHSR